MEQTSIMAQLKEMSVEIGNLVTRIAVLETQVSELMWAQRLLLGAVLVTVIGAVLGLIIKRKNGS